MKWPRGIYVATKSLGVFYTDDFTDVATQPTWTAVNTGLANLDCREFATDPYDPENKQYVLTTTGRIIYRRDNQGTWASILTPAEVDTLLSTSGVFDLWVLYRPIHPRQALGFGWVADNRHYTKRLLGYLQR